MREPIAQIITLVRSFEEADRDGVVLSHEQRAAATRRAVIVTTREGGHGKFSREGGIRNDETVARRARLLFNALSRRVPSLRRVLELARLRSLMGPVLFTVALLLGLATSLFGPAGRLDLLAVPLPALLAWNLAALASLLGWRMARGWVRGKANGRTVLLDPDRVITGLAGWVVRFALLRSRLGRKRTEIDASKMSRVTARAFTRFCALWHRLTGPLLEARVRRRLHLAAVALAGGVVIGMYQRGITYGYPATWRGTWLSADGLQAILDVVLAPAAMLLGAAVPEVARFRSPASGDPRIWIHLYAMTALLFVIVPRMALGTYEFLRSQRLKSAVQVDLDAGYFRRVLADWRGATRHVQIVPYSFRPSLATLDHLRSLLHDFFGARADIRVRQPLRHGDQTPLPSRETRVLDPDRETYLVVLFDLAQMPEADAHGAFLEGLKTRIDPERERLLVLIDVSDYKRRTAEAERVEERLRLWAAWVGDAGLDLVDFDPQQTAGDTRLADDRMDAVRAALWPGTQRAAEN